VEAENSDKALESRHVKSNDIRSSFTKRNEPATEDVFDARHAMDPQSGVPGRAQMRELLKSDALRTLFGDLVDKNPEQVLQMLQSFSRPRK